MMAKPMKTLELHYPMIQFLIKYIILTLTLLTILCPTATIVVLLAMKYIYLTYVSRIKEKRTNIEIHLMMK